MSVVRIERRPSGTPPRVFVDGEEIRGATDFALDRDRLNRVVVVVTILPERVIVDEDPPPPPQPPSGALSRTD